MSLFLWVWVLGFDMCIYHSWEKNGMGCLYDGVKCTQVSSDLKLFVGSVLSLSDFY